MRYTTIIDIRELPGVYRNLNARLLYTHLCLAAGYHDDDRDIYRCSIRRLADECGLTVSATRHALKVLENTRLIARAGSAIRVRKWLSERTVTPRPKSARQQQQQQAKEAEQRERDERELKAEREKQQREELRKQGKTPFMLYYEQKILESEAGDADAARIVEQRRAQYENEINYIKQQKEQT